MVDLKMKINEVYARPGQLLIEHLLDVARYCEEMHKGTGILGATHDIAKVSKRFQRRLLKGSNQEDANEKEDKVKFRHPIGALEIADYIFRRMKLNDIDRIVFLASIYYHHTEISYDMIQNDIINLMNGTKLDEYLLTEDETKLAFKILDEVNANEMWKNNLLPEGISFEDYKMNKRELEVILREIYDFLNNIDKETKDKFAEIYSTLVEGDWRSSSKYDKIKSTDWENHLNNFLKTFKREISPEFNEIQEVAKNKVQYNKWILTAPTGSGKTEASLLWALNKAKEKNVSKVIYVLPLKGLIEDIHDRFKRYFDNEKVTVWHSGHIAHLLEEFKLKDFQDFDELNFYNVLKRYFVKGDIIITTADQILMTYLNVKRYPIRYGIFRDAVFVFDEIQTYPDLMRALLYEFIDKVPKYAMIMTATLPKDNKLGNFKKEPSKEVFEKWVNTYHNKSNNTEIISEIKDIKLNDVKNHLKDLKEFKSILVIVNTVNKSIELYKAIKSKSEFKRFKKKILLHSTMIGEDRTRRLNEIKESLKSGEEIIVISTQVVEAGVDFSFEAGIREISPIDSIVQTLGRINRKGDYEKSKFIILGNIVKDSKSDKKYLPYSKKEIEDTIKIITDLQNRNQLNRINLESESQIKSINYDDELSAEVISNLSNELVWSVSNIRELLGDELRENLGKKDIFIEKDKTKDEIIKRIQELRSKMKDGTYEEIQKDMEEYLKLIYELQNNVITTWPNRDAKSSIPYVEYKKKFLGEGDENKRS